MSSHLRQKEVFSGTSSMEKVCIVFGSNSLKMSISFDRNLQKSVTLQYYLVVTLRVSILFDMNTKMCSINL